MKPNDDRPRLARRSLQRRITMNPPESFMVYAAALSPQTEQVNNPIAIGPQGQAVMQPPANEPKVDAPPAPAAEEDEQKANAGGDIQLAPAASVASTQEPTASTAAASTASIPSTTPATQVTVTTTAAASTTPYTDTVAAMSTTDTSSAAASAPTTASAASTTRSSSVSTVTASTSTSAAPSASASLAAAAPSRPFTRSAAFIFLCVLASLVLVAVIATSLSWIFRRPWFPCCGSRDDDDDGLSDFLQSNHTQSPSRSSTIRRASYADMSEVDDPESQLYRRSSLFATDPTQSPFLHSGPGNMWPAGGGGGGGAPSIAIPAPAHLYGVTGPLEVRNAVPGDMEGVPAHEDHGTPTENMAGLRPRYMGVDGEGLEVPWSRQTSHSELVGLGIQAPSESNLSSPYISAPDSRDYLGAPFPSPLPSEDHHERMMQTAESSPEHPHPGSPQRAGTWASNLRNTLFAAISGRGNPEGDEDRFTRPILPLHRNSTRRKPSDQAFPIVEEKDDRYMMPHSDAEAIGSVFLAPSFSASTMGVTMPTRAKKVPLRGGAAERYKRYYARSNASSLAEESSSESASAWSADERMPSRLAGGERARGVKGA